MRNTHEQEKKQFIRLFQKQGVEQFDLRLQVLDAFLKLEHHVSINDILTQLKKDGSNLDEPFALNSMDLLCRFGFATKIEFEEKDPRYEHRHLGLHHDHMVCTKCGNILEFKDEQIERLQLKLANAYGFHMLQHKLDIYGICSRCMEDRTGLVTLHRARQGEKLIIKEIKAGNIFQLRLSAMGLKIGDQIEIVSSGFGGQVVIATGENRMVIGKGMAEKIKVETFDPTALDDKSCQSPIMLSKMKAGQAGIIRKVSGKSKFRRRLLEMGINRGASIYIKKYVPLKDPIELVIKGGHVSLRVEEAAKILVEKIRPKKTIQ